MAFPGHKNIILNRLLRLKIPLPNSTCVILLSPPLSSDIFSLYVLACRTSHLVYYLELSVLTVAIFYGVVIQQATTFTAGTITGVMIHHCRSLIMTWFYQTRSLFETK